MDRAASFAEDAVPASAGGETAFDFAFVSRFGTPLPLRGFAGRPMVLVNTASLCGFTPQYAALQALWRRHRADGLVVLGVPSNDFGGQEPGTSTEITNFCRTQYGIEFPVTEKVHVAGPQAHPLFEWLATQGGYWARPQWNFYKYLITRDGTLSTWFGSLTSPKSARFNRAVEALLDG